MYSGVSVALGLGLVVLLIAGFASHAPAWLAVLEGVGALVGFAAAFAFAKAGGAGVAVAALLSFGLFILWIVGLAASGAPQIAWWTFGFASGFAVLAVAAAGRYAPIQRPRET